MKRVTILIMCSIRCKVENFVQQLLVDVDKVGTGLVFLYNLYINGVHFVYKCVAMILKSLCILIILCVHFPFSLKFSVWFSLCLSSFLSLSLSLSSDSVQGRLAGI